MPEIEKTSEAWNVAGGFTQLKILYPLVEMDRLVRIAIYGYVDIQEKFQYSRQHITENRIEAMKRLIDVILEIVENADFACKPEDRDKLEKMENAAKMVQNYFDASVEENYDQRTNQATITINEQHFLICLNVLRKIKKALPKPLNNNSLIFPQSNDVDLSKIKDQMINGG